MFGLLRDVHVWSTVGTESGRFGSLHVILHRFRQLSRWIALGAIHCLRKRSPAKPQREQSTCYCRFPLVVENQYCRYQAAECSRSLHSRQSRVQGTASRRPLETGCLHTWHTPNVPCLIRASASSIARKRRASVWCKRIWSSASASAFARSIRSRSKPPADGTRTAASP